MLLKSGHPTRKLFKEMACVGPYPPGIVPVSEQIPGTSFFPGGTGLWCQESSIEVPPFPVGGVMVLGQDFHNVAGYEKALKKIGENLKSPTWRNLLKLLDRVPIPLTNYFFTNIYMGLREGEETTGPFPGAECLEFKRRCQNFLIQQIYIQRPSVILALGNSVPEFLAPLSPQLSSWAYLRTFKAIDLVGPLIHGVSFVDVPDHECSVVSLIHPCLRHLNIRYRTWKDSTGKVWMGDNAELKMLQYVMAK